MHNNAKIPVIGNTALFVNMSTGGLLTAELGPSDTSYIVYIEGLNINIISSTPTIPVSGSINFEIGQGAFGSGGVLAFNLQPSQTGTISEQFYFNKSMRSIYTGAGSQSVPIGLSVQPGVVGGTDQYTVSFSYWGYQQRP